ncbi:hypothetical protein SPBR_06251 [Sporothrix brasiliensis 5110]|uniref:Calcofluor white hypersensitive protein n=1 Tax=Sporothrix brasiliensis 5110 TaxID=1398154 RepID=A0A0C2J5F3_9PEZI|nr:uncharacterized protein SPBR_06251 [Sporothrix brasiliensis 5110]KIH94210.1 hypothetical protein SPBR_06251 [Sporothrix brasiliensis 5110]
MSRSRTPLYLGIAAAGGIGYYLYSAGGNPKVAEKKFESDLQSVRNRAGGNTNQFRTDIDKYGAEAGAKVDSAINKVQTEYNRAAADVGKKAEETRSNVNKSIDAFDKKVEDAAAKTKNGVSGWFGGK